MIQGNEDLPSIDSAGTVVRNAIGNRKVKIDLIIFGQDETGNLPATKVERKTSFAFQTLTNHILHEATKNQRL